MPSFSNHFIEVFEKWYKSIELKPKEINDAESLHFVIEIQEKLPGPLQLNFFNELERIVDGETSAWFD